MLNSGYESGGLWVSSHSGYAKMVGEADDLRHIPGITCCCVTVA